MSRAITRVLRHPVTMAMKRLIRNSEWERKGATIRNPEPPERLRSILFVCLGNICRSPFAAHLAANKLAALGVRDIVSSSAGIRTTQANRSPQDACESSRGYGVNLDGHEPRQLTKAMVQEADAVVVMEAAQLSQLRAMFPESAGKTWLLALFDGDAQGGYERYNIADPFGHGSAAFDECYTRIDRALHPLLRGLAAARLGPTSNGPS